MYQEFSILSIEAIIQDRQIIVTANKAINPNNTDIVVELYERSSRTPVLIDSAIDGDKLIITLKDWPVPNVDYILGITGITSVTDETLDSNIKKRLKFTSSVMSTVKIVSPVIFEEINSLDIKLVEEASSISDLLNSFYVEIATDNAFYNIVNKANLIRDNITLSLKADGEYYIRARVQQDDSNYSIWSDTIPFVYGKPTDSAPLEGDDDNPADIQVDVDDGEPEVDVSGPLFIVDLPEQGVTPEEGLLIAFSNYLDDMSIDNIIITRKDVR